MDAAGAHRAIATLHGFRFFGLAFLLPGVVGTELPARFADFAAYGDFATGLLVLLALLAFRVRPLFWLFVAAFNVVGFAAGHSLGLTGDCSGASIVNDRQAEIGGLGCWIALSEQICAQVAA